MVGAARADHKEVLRVRRTLLVAVALCLATPAAASAGVPGLSQRDGNALVTMAHAHWPQSPCAQNVMVLLARTGPAARAAGSCTIVLRLGAARSATAWCHAMKPAFARLAAGTPPSVVPYKCSLAVGPRPTRQSLVAVPGLSRADALAAFAVADHHWPHSACRGREQIVPVPESWLTGQSVDTLSGGTIMGMARVHDSRCVVYLDTDLTWTQTLLCITAEHEFGHLLGLGHSPDPGSVMSAVNARSADCEGAFGALPPALGGDAPTTVGATSGFGGLALSPR